MVVANLPESQQKRMRELRRLAHVRYAPPRTQDELRRGNNLSSSPVLSAGVRKIDSLTATRGPPSDMPALYSFGYHG